MTQFKKGNIPWNKGKKMSPEIKKRVSQGLKEYYWTHNSQWKGKKVPKELLEKQIEGRLKYYESHDAPNKGKAHSQATKDKISESCRKAGVGTWNRKYNKKKKEDILVFCKDCFHYLVIHGVVDSYTRESMTS